HIARGELVDLLPAWNLPLAEGDTVHALTLPMPEASESARALVRFVSERWLHGVHARSAP
ncbi:MAG: hypothetical protein ACK5JG_12285, partial [Pseudomonadota bacterium]